MKKILIAGYHGYSNSGDDAILYAICNDIESIDSECKITILSKNPQITEKEYGQSSIDRFDLKSVCKSIKESDLLLMGGGSLLQDNTSTRSLLYYLFLIGYAKSKKKKCILYANGIGPIRKSLNQKLTKWVANKIDLITLRDSQSFELLKQMDINKPEIHITADPVYQLITNPVNVDEVLLSEGIDTSKPLVAVFFRSWSNEREYVEKIAQICDSIHDTYDMNILLIPMKYPSDLNVSMEIAKIMKTQPMVIKNKVDVSTMVEIIGQTKLVLSMRLHALIYASLKAVPMIGFVYDPKVDFYIKELNAFSAGDIHHFEAAKVLESVDQIMNNYEEVKQNIEKRYDELRKKALLNKEYLQKIYDSIR